LELLKPDLIIFAIGINDANTSNFNKELFVSNYMKMVDMARRVAPDCAILFVTNNDSFRRSRRSYYLNQNGPVVQDAFYGLARRYDAGIWDLFRIMGGLNSMKQWESAGLANRDKIHFTEGGYILIGDLLYNALLDRYLEHLKSTSSKNNGSR
jgi:lysophospholipase L1-like esterase